MKFRISYRMTTSVRVRGTIEADTKEEALALVALGESLEDEDVEPDGNCAPSSLDSIDVEQVNPGDEEDDGEDDDDFLDDEEDDDNFGFGDDEEDDDDDDDEDDVPGLTWVRHVPAKS